MKLFASFHIGRGGQFHNQGHLSFVAEENFQQLIGRCSDVCTIFNEDEDGNPLPDEEWVLVDCGGNIIIQGRDEIEAETGRLEWDGEYDTDYVKVADEELREDEIAAIFKAYLEGEYMSDELKDAICTLKGFYRVRKIRKYPTKLELSTTNGNVTIDFDGLVGELSINDWRIDLFKRGFDGRSIKRVLVYLERCSTYDKEFFLEDN